MLEPAARAVIEEGAIADLLKQSIQRLSFLAFFPTRRHGTIADRDSCAIFVEVKSDGGPQSDEQKGFARNAIAARATYAMVRSLRRRSDAGLLTFRVVDRMHKLPSEAILKIKSAYLCC